MVKDHLNVSSDHVGNNEYQHKTQEINSHDYGFLYPSTFFTYLPEDFECEEQ